MITVCYWCTVEVTPLGLLAAMAGTVVVIGARRCTEIGRVVFVGIIVQAGFPLTAKIIGVILAVPAHATDNLLVDRVVVIGHAHPV